MHIGILGSPDNPYVKELQRAASEHFSSLTTEVLRFGDLQVGLGDAATERAVIDLLRRLRATGRPQMRNV